MVDQNLCAHACKPRSAEWRKLKSGSRVLPRDGLTDTWCTAPVHWGSVRIQADSLVAPNTRVVDLTASRRVVINDCLGRLTMVREVQKILCWSAVDRVMA